MLLMHDLCVLASVDAGCYTYAARLTTVSLDFFFFSFFFSWITSDKSIKC